MDTRIRRATEEDEDLLWLTLGQDPPDVPGESEHDSRTAHHGERHYVEGWGRAGDVAIIAEDVRSGGFAGAAWLRLFTVDDPSYGFVDEATPELGIGIRLAYRGQRLGGRLMDAMLEIAAETYPQVCLSVEDQNERAIKLYRSRGFKEVRHEDGAFAMLLRFQD